MTLGLALALVGAALLLWPVPSQAQWRLLRLRQAARVAAPALAAPVPAAGSIRAAAERDRAVAAVAVLVGGGCGVVTGGSVTLGVAGAAAATAVAVVVVSSRSARRQAIHRRDLLTALAVLRGELDAGTSFPDALAVARARAGPAAAVLDLAAAPTVPDARDGPAVAHAHRCLRAGAGLVAATGAPWSAVAAGIARDLAAHDAREREVGAALAGARASTVVVAALPVLGLGLAAALGADPVAFLLGTATGRALLAAGAVLDLLGVLASTALAARAAR